MKDEFQAPKIRATYRPPVVQVVLHHTETQNNSKTLLNDNPVQKS